MTAVFAIPGDKDRRTGGFIYEATVLETLTQIGCEIRHLTLPDSFPDPTPADMATTLQLLAKVPRNQPIILDGLVYGSIDPVGLAQIKAPLIAMIHHPLGLETGLKSTRARALLKNETAALSHAAHVIVPSPHTAQILVRDFGVDAELITIAEPGFTRPTLAPASTSPPLILSVGLLAPRKGHDILIQALATLRDLPWRCEIVGKALDQAYADELAALLIQNNLTDRITLTGEIGADSLQSRYRAASIFALATRYEGYGMVLSEAMLHGLPVVSCAVGAVPDTVGQAGLLVPRDDVDAFAQSLHRLLSDPEAAQSFSQKSRAKAATLMRWDDTAQIFARVIQSLIPPS